MGCENKFKVGDRVRCIDDGDTSCVKRGEEYDVMGVHEPYIDVLVDGELHGMYAHRFELIPSLTIEPGRHYRTRSGKPTGRVTVGDTGFEAVVDGKVRIFDRAGGAVHGDDDIVEAWVPKVGERVRFVRDNTDGGAEYGAKGEVVTVMSEASEVGNCQIDVSSSHFSWNPGAYLSDLEPLPVAAPQPAAPTLKIEAGRYYKTRDGRKVGPIRDKDDLNDHYPFRADGGPGGTIYYRASGTCNLGWSQSGSEDFDLIAEWPTAQSNVGTQVDAIAEEYGPAPQPEPDTTLNIKFTSDFSELDAAILVRKKKLKKLIKLASKAGIDLREAA